MARDLVSLRLDREIIKGVERYAAELGAEANFSSVVRTLLRDALSRVDVRRGRR